MFYYLSKTLDALLSPLTWATLLFLIALGLSAKRRRAALICGIAGLLILLIFSSEAVSSVLWRIMEAPAVTTMQPGVQYDAVIVLSGMVDDVATEAHDQPSYNDNIERLLAGFQLLREGKAKSVLLSGGSGRFDRSGPVEADVLAQQLEKWGIDKTRIVEERLSRNTRENATESAKVVAQQHWSSLLLVTSAFHMPRALACFRAAGLKVDTLVVDYRTGAHSGGWFPRAGALAGSTAALRELFGRVVYRIVGFAR
jgi:uncharacterized SAM-binding protein YcdF (DUF218 family)